MQRAVISGTGAYIPHETKTNYDFVVHNFYGDDHTLINAPPVEIVEKFKLITGIEERRYAPHDLNASDIGAIAAKCAIEDSGINPETLDQIIVAHNFGNVIKHSIQTDLVPSLANRIKHSIGIRNPNCICYDIIFGCPGWLQGVIQADAFFKAGMAKKVLVIGTETLSRVIDLYDRDCMIFSDGAGATVLEANSDENGSGIIGTAAQSYSVDEAYYINLGKSYLPDADPGIRYLKMKGRKVYEFAIKVVPRAMKECIEKSGVSISDVKKIFIHQANEKMDEVIIKNMYKLFGYSKAPENIMPMNIRELGNSSVATIPTLLDMVRKGQLPEHEVKKGDIVLFASVGAGMNINAACYRV
jgi:3-oxoacyl-[acyl-carrier-protein] synthase-3